MCSEAEPSRAGTRYRLEVVFRLEVLGTFFYRLLVVEVLETRSPFVLFLSLLEVRLETLTQELVPRLPRGAGTAKPLPPRFLRAWVLVQNMNLSENADDGKRPARTSERGALAVWLAAAVRLVVARWRARAHGLPRHFAETTATILVKVAERMQSLWTALHKTSALVCAGRGKRGNVSGV